MPKVIRAHAVIQCTHYFMIHLDGHRPAMLDSHTSTFHGLGTGRCGALSSNTIGNA